jgi:DNA-binding NtrC family response regulator
MTKSSASAGQFPLDQIFTLDERGKLNFADSSKATKIKLEKAILNFFVEYFYMNENAGLKEFMESLERTILIKILAGFNGNQKKTAAFLRMNLTTLNEKIKRHNIRFQKTPIEG